MKPSAPTMAGNTAPVQVRASPVVSPQPDESAGAAEFAAPSSSKATPIRVNTTAVRATPVAPATTDTITTGKPPAGRTPIRARPVSMTVTPVSTGSSGSGSSGGSGSGTSTAGSGTRSPYNLGNMNPTSDTRGKPTGNSYALVIGSSDRQGLVSQTVNVEIATKNVLSSQLSVVVSDQFNKTYGARISDNGDSTFTCSFTPSFSGRYSIDISLDDNAVGGSPVRFAAMDAPSSSPTTPVRRVDSKSKELDEPKTQRDGKPRTKTTAGSQTYREASTAEKPRKKKKKVSNTSGTPDKPTTKKTKSTKKTTKKKAPKKVEEPEQLDEDDQEVDEGREEQPNEDD